MYYLQLGCFRVLRDQGIHSSWLLSQKESLESILRNTHSFIFPVLIISCLTSRLRVIRAKKIKSEIRLKGFGGKEKSSMERGGDFVQSKASAVWNV